ncbi:MAG: EamA family transporter [Prolixibacteraceae bacterium]|jgi:transporter family protein|nr:EamA family transporter [Prolixibacteraceae bacterium]
MWAIWAILAAVLLGIYDVLKKVSLNNNAVIPTLLFSVSTGAILFIPIIIGSRYNETFFQSVGLFVPVATLKEHLLIFIKSTIVVSSWILAFFAMKNLPLTIVSPIRATGPFWTMLGAITIFSEKLNAFQWTGILITLVFFYMFSTVGKLEGINFRKNKWILFLIAATLLGTVSGLYDKYIIRNVDRVAVQAWFSVYQMLIMIPVTAFIWYPRRQKLTPFTWRWTIPLIGIFLILTDYVYFYAISYPDSLISIISGIRRSGVVIPFIFAAIFLKEKNVKRKGVYLAGIIVGVLLMVMGS